MIKQWGTPFPNQQKDFSLGEEIKATSSEELRGGECFEDGFRHSYRRIDNGTLGKAII